MKKTFAALLTVCALVLTGCAAKTYEKTNTDKYLTLGDYKGLTYTPADTTASDYDVECAVRKLLANAGYETEVFDQINEGTVRLGDTLNINYAGRYPDGEAFAGGTADNQSLEIGSSQFIAGFEEKLIGVKVGDTVELNLTFPKSYGNKELAGQDVVFTVKVNYITARKNYPEMTDAIAHKLDETAENTEQLYANTRKQLEDANAASAESTLRSDLWSQAVSNCTFADKLPKSLKNSAQEEFTNYYTAQALQSGYSSLSEWLTANGTTQSYFDQQMETYSTSMVQSQLTAWAIVKAEGYAITDKIFDEKSAKYATSAGYEDTASYITAIGEDPIRDQIALDFAVDLVLENAVAQEG